MLKEFRDKISAWEQGYTINTFSCCLKEEAENFLLMK
ncbi:hypothetical protein DFR42_101980 [Undibacterium pigrum]|uniref:Uncharacterized protein n=1 Tax=Undibacterium pigrum TaxID=401470 RepID=A0A318JJX0_9BURK|nr:hypothetical protein DFR42_101980 [Undibacterium pigrum]